jgi:hypothetical protein
LEERRRDLEAQVLLCPAFLQVIGPAMGSGGFLISAS